jgi:hypothetical protein
MTIKDVFFGNGLGKKEKLRIIGINYVVGAVVFGVIAFDSMTYNSSEEIIGAIGARKSIFKRK